MSGTYKDLALLFLVGSSIAWKVFSYRCRCAGKREEV